MFGPNPGLALKLKRGGASKEEIYAESRTTVGVYNASFTVEQGEIFVVMGLSGSGKSTLIRCVNRIHEPDAGRVQIGGTDVTALDRKGLEQFRRTSVAMVFQRFALFPHRTVWANVEYGLEVKGVPPNERRRRAEEVLAMVGLEGWGDRLPHQLSGGMQQRVGLARALAVDPEVLLMDEAFSALDPLIKREMQDELLSLQSRMRKTILFITHDLDEALKLGNRIAVMRDGEIIQVGTAEEIISRPADDYVAAFTSGVDRSKVLSAGAVMKRPEPLIRPGDGPHAALRRMGSHGISSVFMVDPEGRLMGLLEAESARRAADEGRTSVVDLLDRDVQTVHPDTPLHEVLRMTAAARWPIAVVDNAQKMKGVLVKGAIFAALAPETPKEDENGTAADVVGADGSIAK